MASDSSQFVRYEGPPLRSATRYRWQVRITDDRGKRSGWSEVARFETGLFDAADWGEARWIHPAPDSAHSSQPAPYLRTVFEVSGAIASARLYATADGVYETHLNGRRVGDAHYSPPAGRVTGAGCSTRSST